MRLFYYIFVVKAWFISQLPFKCLYFLSGILSYLLFYLFRYRKKVVFTNLKHTFPEKTHEEIRAIAKNFYRNLCDLIFEFIKINNISLEGLMKRVRFTNEHILDELYLQGKSIIAITGHIGNWEWVAMVLDKKVKYDVCGIVKPLSNNDFDRYMNRLRSKFGGRDRLIPFKETFRVLIKNRNKKTINVIAADQTPTKSEINYWTSFLNQDTGVFLGPEKIARTLDFAVVFLNTQREGRGKYVTEIIRITDNPKDCKEYEITEKHVQLLEKIIHEHPDNWLWSHKRWKHKIN